jgi:ferredoxin-NADP reductase
MKVVLLAAATAAIMLAAGPGVAQTVSATSLAAQQRAQINSTHSAHTSADILHRQVQDEARQERARKKAKKQAQPKR